ncbi:MAG: AbrB/MazE/SpoVT family DNA-binding domain-containing protein [Terrimicrobiaceae bacterium]
MNAILSEKGQVTIPKTLRDSLGLRPGVVLDFTEDEGCLVARKVSREDPLEKWRGKGELPKRQTVDQYLARVREGK